MQMSVSQLIGQLGPCNLVGTLLGVSVSYYVSFIELYWKLTKLWPKNRLKNRVDFYHTFCPGNHRDGNEYLSTQSISNFEKLHSLKEEHCECVLTALCCDSSLFWYWCCS